MFITKSGWSYPHKKDKMKFQVLSSEGYSQNLYHPAPWDFPALVEPLLQLGWVGGGWKKGKLWQEMLSGREYEGTRARTPGEGQEYQGTQDQEY